MSEDDYQEPAERTELKLNVIKWFGLKQKGGNAGKNVLEFCMVDFCTGMMPPWAPDWKSCKSSSSSSAMSNIFKVNAINITAQGKKMKWMS